MGILATEAKKTWLTSKFDVKTWKLQNEKFSMNSVHVSSMLTHLLQNAKLESDI